MHGVIGKYIEHVVVLYYPNYCGEVLLNVLLSVVIFIMEVTNIWHIREYLIITWKVEWNDHESND